MHLVLAQPCRSQINACPLPPLSVPSYCSSWPPRSPKQCPLSLPRSYPRPALLYAYPHPGWPMWGLGWGGSRTGSLGLEGEGFCIRIRCRLRRSLITKMSPSAHVYVFQGRPLCSRVSRLYIKDTYYMSNRSVISDEIYHISKET